MNHGGGTCGQNQNRTKNRIIIIKWMHIMACMPDSQEQTRVIRSFFFFLFFMRTFNESTRWQINITHKHWQSSIRMPRLLNFSFRLIHDGGSACPSTALSIQHCNKWIIFHTVNESENEMTAIYCLKLIWNAGWKLYEWHLWSVVSAECRLAIERGT